MARLADHPPAFLFDVDDFVSDNVVEAMTTEQIGAYMLLLCKAWREDPCGTIPDDDAILARWARLTPSRWKYNKRPILKAFKRGDDGRWHQKRMKRTYSDWLAGKERRRRGARAGAEARWGGCESQCGSIESASLLASESHEKIAQNGCEDDAKKCQSKSKSKSNRESIAKDQNQSKGEPTRFDQQKVEQDAWAERFLEFTRQLEPTTEDRRFVAQLAWLVCAGAPILPQVRDALDGITTIRRDGNEIPSPVGYLNTSLQRSLGSAELKSLLGAAPSRAKCRQIVEAAK